MSKDDTPSPGGLLSKVVRFVRNPTVNWSELDSLQVDRESQYSKQVLKDMLERKRRNDFVRRREFDQLRKLRERDALSSQRMPEPPARTSLFQSSFTSPDERAVTIRKIDEIEAQMSKQWWKGNAPALGVPLPPSLAVADSGDAASAAPPFHTFSSTAPLSLPMALAAHPQAGEPPQPSASFRRSSFSARQALAPAGLAAATPVAGAAAAVFAHDPDLEDAAILFANGDSAGAEASLLEVLTQRAGDAAPQQFEIWMTLFDLYRATGQQDRFEAIGLDFAARFHRSAPLWFSLPEMLGLGAAALASAPAAALQSDKVWSAPTQLTVQSVAALQAWLARNPTPWTLAWSRLLSIDESALPALTSVFSQWAEQPVHLVFTDASTLHALWQAHTVSDARGTDPQWWQLRMAALRCMNQPDAFEMVALDYCVTYEVSPPSWQVPQCTYQDASQPVHGSDGSVADSGPVSTSAHGLPSAGHWGDSTQPLTLPGHFDGAESLPGLEGCVQGDAGNVLDARANASTGTVLLCIPCERLIRLDFAAAGSVLNWAARQQGQGRTLRFERLHRLAAVFFNVIGINEYAVVQPRED